MILLNIIPDNIIAKMTLLNSLGKCLYSLRGWTEFSSLNFATFPFSLFSVFIPIFLSLSVFPLLSSLKPEKQYVERLISNKDGIEG